MYHPSWNIEAKSQFEKCVLAHGGWPAWEKLSDVTFELKEFSGFLLFIKGLNRRFFTPTQININVKNHQVLFKYPDHSDEYKMGKLISGLSQQVYPEGKDLFSKKNFEQWSPLHALYFFGYALINYLSYPFILRQFELLAFKSNGTRSIFKVRFPKEWRTHSEIQTFYFDSKNLLYRHDYEASLVGPIVKGAHFTKDYQRYKGLMFAKTRRVFPRQGLFYLPINAIYARLEFIN